MYVLRDIYKIEHELATGLPLYLSSFPVFVIHQLDM